MVADVHCRIRIVSRLKIVVVRDIYTRWNRMFSVFSYFYFYFDNVFSSLESFLRLKQRTDTGESRRRRVKPKQRKRKNINGNVLYWCSQAIAFLKLDTVFTTNTPTIHKVFNVNWFDYRTPNPNLFKLTDIVVVIFFLLCVHKLILIEI